MEKIIFELNGFNCAGCITKIEDAICKFDGVVSCKINFVTSTMKVEGTNLDCQKIKNTFLKYEPHVKIEVEEDEDFTEDDHGHDCACGSSH